ncbi:DNA repair protein RadC [Candidatus Sulfidibacterium hydrothermale]|uniref:RadC family protein n=1 Tax=Candidatus Sulfidibacterium hydrothermale TaxID=2875962 RepID=UPI001F0AFDD5|nr:DNA repair protein RadC [Candidatus Sulfidibacterium hydrothermale]UBM63318.1 DNA repair protein RadC [Candidatus Sulfidibacterium hydrothermale]
MKPTISKDQPIRLWAEDDRPREKMLLKGKNSLSNAELIALLIGSGNGDESAVQLARRMLESVDNNLITFSKLGIEELSRFRGMGKAKAISILAAFELGKRRVAEGVIRQAKITSSRDMYELLLPELTDRYYEAFYVVFLDRANKIIRKLNISTGGVAGTVVDPKRIFKQALDFNASSIILAHNHPSDNLKPSENDIKLTRKLKRAGEALDISVLDHIIVGNDNYFSFADEGLL